MNVGNLSVGSQLFSNLEIRVVNTQFNTRQKYLDTPFHLSPPPSYPFDTVEINEALRQKVRSLTKSIEAGQDGYMQMKYADSGLRTVKKVLQQMSKLAFQAAEDTVFDGDRAILQLKLDKWPDVLDETANRVTYNNKPMLDGTYSAQFKLGASSKQKVTLKLDDVRATALGVDSLDISSQSAAKAAYKKLDEAIKTVDDQLNRVELADNRIRKALNAHSRVMDSIVPPESQLRNMNYASEIIDSLRSTLLNPEQSVITADKLHNSKNETVLQLLASALGYSYKD